MSLQREPRKTAVSVNLNCPIIAFFKHQTVTLSYSTKVQPSCDGHRTDLSRRVVLQLLPPEGLNSTSRLNTAARKSRVLCKSLVFRVDAR